MDGADAARPRFTENAHTKVGYGWLTTDVGGKQITRHNGRTGGFSSFAGYDAAVRPYHR